MSDTARTAAINLRLTPDEKQVIREAAAKAGMSAEAWVRRSAAEAALSVVGSLPDVNPLEARAAFDEAAQRTGVALPWSGPRPAPAGSKGLVGSIIRDATGKRIS